MQFLKWRGVPDPLELGGSDQLDRVSMTDYLQYATVCLDDFLPKGQEVDKGTCHWDFFRNETVGISVQETDHGDSGNHCACSAVAFCWRALWGDRGGREEPVLRRDSAGRPAPGRGSS